MVDILRKYELLSNSIIKVTKKKLSQAKKTKKENWKNTGVSHVTYAQEIQSSLRILEC